MTEPTFVLHLGTRDPLALIEHINSLALNLALPVTAMTDGDGWEQWGEQTAEAEGTHVMVQTTSDVTAPDLLALAADVMHEHPSLLIPMTFDRQRGTLACITPSDDWSEPVYELTDIRYKRARHAGDVKPTSATRQMLAEAETELAEAREDMPWYAQPVADAELRVNTLRQVIAATETPEEN